MKGFITTLALSLCLLGLTAQAEHNHLAEDDGRVTGEETNCFPKTNVQRPINKGLSLTGLSEKDFNDVLDKVEAIYKPIFKSKKMKLKVKRKWKNGTINASARPGFWPFNKTRIVNMFGGLARHEAVTADGFALVACHEIGHHIGGVPKTSRAKWATNEGQADYFASLKCLRKVFASDNNVAIVSAMNVPALAQEQCLKTFSNNQEAAICMRTSMAGLSVANLFKALRKSPTPLKFSTPDKNVVVKTIHSHPATQCRLDTYFQGAICHVNKSVEVSNKSAETGTCNRRLGDVTGVRPLCWFKPATGAIMSLAQQ